ncbi:MAG TPA: hypothetical protein VMV72_13540 [Verrucomicrobiae bacterium]|nr:hypothetical protein [Verrucomicrobiae bacterium]
MPYALLLKSLDQTIDRETLEAAAAASKAIPLPDCARLQRELYGILVDDLDQDHAAALQGELFARNFPTEVVDQSQLPVLNDPAPAQGLDIGSDGVTAIDLYGNTTLYPWDHFVFAAAGYVLRLVDRPHVNRWEVEPEPFRSKYAPPKLVVDYKLESIPEFHLDLFFDVEPYRLRWVWDRDTILRVNQQPVRLKEHEKFVALLLQLAQSAPAERLNQGIQKLTAGEYSTYPSVHAFEEEIVWSFYQLMRQDA